jgi:hypothetical protein
MTELERRRNAVMATQARFDGKPFAWDRQATCIHLLRFHAAQMGHQVPIVPRFRSAIGAVKALKREGVETLPELMDKYFPRIPASKMLMGDVACFPGDGMDALMVYGQLRAFLGWHEDDAPCQPCRVTDEGYALCKGAWRL